jgi:hypothetical protein
MTKSKCIFCKRLYVDIIKHEENCVKQFKVLIGPDYEKVKCKHCPREFYKADKHYWDYFQDKLVHRTEYGIWKHLRAAHRITENIEEHYEAIIHIPEVDPEPEEIPESTITKRIPNSSYTINEYGVITNLAGKVRKPCQNINGSFSMILVIEGERTKKLLSNLVASVFVDNPENYRYVIHKDGNNQNNHYTNLEWSDKKEHIKIK